MQISFSYFHSARDNQPKRMEKSWSDFCQFALEPRTPSRVEEGDDPKKGMPAISPATFRPGTNRSIRNVEALGFMAFDYDNSDSMPTEEPILNQQGAPTGRFKTQKVRIDDPVSMEEVQDLLGRRGIDHLVHPSWSDKPDWPHFHLIIPLSAPVRPDQWPAVTAWTIEHLGLGPTLRGLDRPVLADVARIYFLPGGPHGKR